MPIPRIRQVHAERYTRDDFFRARPIVAGFADRSCPKRAGWNTTRFSEASEGKTEFPSGRLRTLWGTPPDATGVNSMLQATRTWVSRFLFHPHALSLTCGAAAGTAWIAVCAVYWTAFEPVPTARVTFALAWSLTLAILWSPRVSGLLSHIPHFWRVGAASCGLALWPTVWKAVLSRREFIPLDWYAGEWTSLAAMAIPALLTLVPAIGLGCLLCPAPSVDSTRSRSNPLPSFWLGVALSWCVLPTTLFVRASADQVLLGLSACLLVGAGVSLFLRGEMDENTTLTRPELGETNVARTPTSVSPGPRGPGYGIDLISLVGALLIGLTLEAANRAAEQLVLESLPLKFFGWAGFYFGAAVFAGLRPRNIQARAGLRRTLFLTALAAAAVIVLFPVWICLGIWSSATLSSLVSIMLAKGLIPFGIMLPIGCACGSLLSNNTRRSLFSVLIGVGYVLATAFTGPMVAVLMGVTVVATSLSLALWPASEWKALTTRRGMNRPAAALAACLCLVAVTISCQGWINPARSAQLLFSGEAFAAAGSGHDLLTIERADRSRWLKTIEGDNGVWTVWRQRANQLVVRRNGLPAGQLSLDPALGPQNFWSILATAVPLVVHPKADDVLCLGAPGAVEINTLLGFPVQSLTCVEADRDVRTLIEYEATLMTTPSRLQDGRLEWVTATPMQFATSLAPRTYDVIVCPEISAVPLRSQPQFTREFHARMAGHLNEGGLFCQRMNIVDFGSTPLIDTLRSLRSAFEQTSVITTDGSEVLLLATNSPAPLFEPGFVTRLETPQIQRLCATLGADWSAFTQLACVPAEAVDELLAGASGTPNSCVNARFAMKLASETLRWGPKWKEKQALFANRTELILTAMKLEEEPEQIVARRIQDAQERVRILTETADDQWSYRRVLKGALKDRPRTSIQKVNHEIRQALIPEDQHRKAYMVALGRAAREEFPTLEAIERVEKFAAPYDPLVTDFVSFEVAHLLGRMKVADPAREYQHWMHCITYAPGNDRSVLPVAAALDLLRRNPEIVPDAAWRWDQFSQLLDVMRVRWAGRWQADAPSRYEAADMQRSSEAVTATLSTMDDLATEAGVNRETWKVQRRIWEESLVTPTRARQENHDPKDQMLESVRQEWMRRNSELTEPK